GGERGQLVCREAEFKVPLQAEKSIRIGGRAREHRQRSKNGKAVEKLSEINRGDSLDSRREISPLVQTEDAQVLDNTHMSIPEQIDAVVNLAAKRIPRPVVSPDEILYKPDMLPEEYRLTLRIRPIYRIAWRLVWLLGKLLFGIRMNHWDRSPKEGGLLVASNHVAWLDPPMAGLAVKRELTFVAKKELFRNRLFGGFITYFNAVPINRGSFDRSCFDTLGERLRSGGTVFFFPEGTRKPLGRLGKAKWGLGLMAAESRCPVQPVFVKGTKHWMQALIRRKRVELYLGRPLHVQPLIDRGLEGREFYEVFGEGVMAEIARLQEEAGGPF
nr:1-acyl-sn-glycerol-3-phosphate acyltransferase [bacterium]